MKKKRLKIRKEHLITLGVIAGIVLVYFFVIQFLIPEQVLLSPGDNLIAYYKFDNKTINSVTGTEITRTDNFPSYVPGKSGAYAAEFNGTNTKINLGNIQPTSENPSISFSLWVKANSFPTENNGDDGIKMLLAKDASGARGYHLAIKTIPDINGPATPPRFTFQTHTAATTYSRINSSQTLETNRWYHLVVVYDYQDSSTIKMRMYINGNLESDSITNYDNGGFLYDQANAFGPIISTPNQNLLIGKRALSNYPGYFDGAIDNLRIYKTVLTETEIQELYTKESNCGNGNLDTGEQCDEGANNDINYHCNSECQCPDYMRVENGVCKFKYNAELTSQTKLRCALTTTPPQTKNDLTCDPTIDCTGGLNALRKICHEQYGECEPNCQSENRVCGSDSCWGTCGTCPGTTCIEETGICVDMPTTGANYVKIEKQVKKLNLGEKISDVISNKKITSEEMPTLLEDLEYTDNDDRDFNYAQEIELADLKLTMFNDSNSAINSPVIGVQIAQYNPVLIYTLEFEDHPLWNDMPDSQITILGQEYTITETKTGELLTLTDSSGSTLFLEQDKPLNISHQIFNQTKVSFTNLGNNLQKITINWNANNNLSITPNNDIVMPGLGDTRLSFTGMQYPSQEKFSVQTTQENIELNNFPLLNTTETIPLIYSESNKFKGIGKDSNSKIATSNSGTLTFDWYVDSYFIASFKHENLSESYIIRAKDFETNSDQEKTITIQTRKNNAWVNINQTVPANAIIMIGNVNLTISSIDTSNKQITLTAGNQVVFNKLYSKQGLEVELPTTNPAQSYHILKFHEEDINNNIGQGSHFEIKFNWNTTLGKEYIYASEITGHSPDFTQIQNTKKYKSFIYSPLATELIWDKSNQQYSVDITYHGAESYGELYLMDSSGPCTPECGTRTCGPSTNNCGSSNACGTCLSNQDCTNGICIPRPCASDWEEHKTSCKSGDIRTIWYTDKNHCNSTTKANETEDCDYDNNNIIGDFDDLEESNTNITILIEGEEADIDDEFDEEKTIELLDDDETIVEFDYDFEDDTLNIRDIKIKKQSSSASYGYTIINGIDADKTVIVDRLKSGNQVCIRNRNTPSISSFTSRCTASQEYLVNCPGTKNNFECSISTDGEKFIVSGLTHSAVREFVSTSQETTCTPNWETGSWTPTTCPTNKTQTRTVTDLKYCGTTNKPTTTRTCTITSSGTTTGIDCTSNWNCEEWSKCEDEEQTRICTDLNDCASNKTETQSCKKSSWLFIIIIITFILLIIAVSITLIYFAKKNKMQTPPSQPQTQPIRTPRLPRRPMR